MARRLRYHVAMSLDGFIAGPNGEFDWIVGDPAIDFELLYKEFDTVVMGRKTYDVMTAQGGDGSIPGMDVVVFSRTLDATTRNGLRIVHDDPAKVVKELKAKRGRDIWLFGGGALFRSLLDAGLVDTVEPAVMPVVLGNGIPLLPPGASTKVVLSDQKILPRSGIVVLAYSIPGGVSPAPRVRFVRTKPRTRFRKPKSQPKRSTASKKRSRAAKKPRKRGHVR